MSQVTIKDLASTLGLSVSTISRALHNHPDIKSETKKTVISLAEELGYKPNIVARNLKAKYSNQIGIIVPEIKHDFFAKAISGIEEIAYRDGFSVIISQSNEDEEREKINANSLYLHRTAGMIVSLSQTTHNIDHFINLMKKGVKIVFFDRVYEGLDSYQVVIDDFQASYNAVDYLISKGRKNIVHLAGPQVLLNCKGRLEGYKQAVLDNGLPFDERLVIIGGMHEGDGTKELGILIETGIKFDAVFAVNDPVAIGSSVTLKKLGYGIPDDVAIIGFSNNPITGYVTPSITTVEQPSYEMGKKSASILISLIKGEEDSNLQKKTVLPTKLIIRESA
jgi:LacI family transcriptional regulator